MPTSVLCALLCPHLNSPCTCRGLLLCGEIPSAPYRPATTHRRPHPFHSVCRRLLLAPSSVRVQHASRALSPAFFSPLRTFHLLNLLLDTALPCKHECSVREAGARRWWGVQQVLQGKRESLGLGQNERVE